MSFNSTPKELIEQNINGLLSIHDSWQRIPMDAIAKITNGFAFKSSEFNTNKDGLPLIRIRDVLKGNTSTYYSGPVPEGYWVNPEDLIVGMDGDFNTTIWCSEPALLNQRVCKIDIDEEKYSKRFFFHTLPGYLSAINENTSSVTVKHLSSRTLQETLFPLPPLAEQKIIAEKLDTLLAQVDSTKARLEQIPQILKRFRQAVLVSAVNGKFQAESSSKECCTIDSLCLTSFDGPFGSKLKTSDYTNSGVRVVRLENIGHLEFNSEKETYISHEKYKSLYSNTLKENDLIFSSFVDEDVRVCLIPQSEEIFINKADCFCLRVDPSLASPHYLALVLASKTSYEQIKEKVQGITRPRINLRTLRSLKFDIPDLKEQHEIVRRVEQLFAYADTIEKQVNNALTRVNNLTQSILAKAFRGELTAQWRAENPDLISGENSAAALLEKIKAERAASGGKKTSRKKS
ncbi:MAG: restriction endonuclease subunit S [Citrobacter portucalensis]|nr:restriction endonuclease subunit S [Citrobacter portucalensis]